MSGLKDVDERAVVHAVQSGDEPTFTALIERHRRELQVHCHRMLGSLVESEDLVEETFLRAWSKRETFQGRSTFRAWLYRIATNACLDVLDQRRRRVLPMTLCQPPTLTAPAGIRGLLVVGTVPGPPSGDEPVQRGGP